MKAPTWVWAAVLATGAALILWGWFVLGFMTEPSAVGRLRSGLLVLGLGSIVVGIVSAVAGLAFVVARLARRK